MILLLAFLAMRCGQIQIAGGSSEIGNPKTGLHGNDGSDSTSVEVTGFGISAQDGLVIFTRKKTNPPRDSSRADTTFQQGMAP